VAVGSWIGTAAESFFGLRRFAWLDDAAGSGARDPAADARRADRFAWACARAISSFSMRCIARATRLAT
jgi:hypothetical protein